MSKTVHKYPVPVHGKPFSHMLQEGFKFLRTSLQQNEPHMWVEVHPESPKMETRFQLFGTGHEIPAKAKYLGTFDYGPLVLHLYQL